MEPQAGRGFQILPSSNTVLDQPIRVRVLHDFPAYDFLIMIRKVNSLFLPRDEEGSDCVSTSPCHDVLIPCADVQTALLFELPGNKASVLQDNQSVVRSMVRFRLERSMATAFKSIREQSRICPLVL